MRELQLTLARIHCIPDGGKSWKSQGAIPGPGCGRGKELCPARSQGSAGGAERRCGPRGAAPRGCHRPRTCGKLRHRAAGGSGALGARGGGGAAGPAGSGAPRGWAAVPGAAGHHGRAMRFSPVPQRCPGRPDRQTDRSRGSAVSEHGLLKDDAQPTDAA